MDIGHGQAVALPPEESRRCSEATNPQWPIMHAVLTGIDRNAMMAWHKANHIQVAYANSAPDADRALAVKAALAENLGITVNLRDLRVR